MGLIISRFRKKRTTGETLAALDFQINSIEQYGRSTEKQRRKVVGNLMIISVGLYITVMIFFYFYFRPTGWRDILFYCTPFLVSPFLIVLLRTLIAKFYDWKLRRNRRKLQQMKDEKKRILEDVMDNETYKVAKDLLEKYGRSELEKPSTALAVAVRPVTGTPISIRPPLSSTPTSSFSGSPALKQRQGGTLGFTSGPNISSIVSVGSTPMRMAPPIPGTPNQLTPLQSDHLPRPVMSSTGGAFDRLVDYLIGDGPANRFALICSNCKGHNGMALPEEFEYLSYRCAYCRHPNQAKKTRPRPPMLLSTPIHTDTSDHKSSSENSDSDESPKRRSPNSINASPKLSHNLPSAPPPEPKVEEAEASPDEAMSIDEETFETLDVPKDEVDKKED